jgi:hypothetical protein
MTWTPRVELVRGLLVKRPRPTSLYALPGVGKGNVAVYMLLCIRHGLPVFGHETRPVDWYGYLDGEDDQAELERRAVRIAKGLDVPLDDSLSYVEVPFKLNTPNRRREIEAILAEWSKQGEGVVVYDSAQALFGGNQASGEVGDEVYSQVKTWAQRYNHTAIVIDHVSKKSASKGGGAMEYGSIFKRARVGASHYLKQVEAIDSQTTVIDLFNPKSNTTVVDTRKGAKPLVRFTIHFDDRPGGAICFAVQPQDWSRLDALGDEPVTITEAMKVLRLSRSRTTDLFKQAVGQGEIRELPPLPGGRGRPAVRYQRVCKAA